MPRTFQTSDPRRPDLAQPYRYQATDSTLTDLATVASMVCSGAAMLTRFAIWPWFGIIFAVSALLGEKSLGANKRTGDQGSMLSGWTALMFAGTGLFSIYTPLLTGQAVKAQGLPFGLNKGLIHLPQQAKPPKVFA
ncbi:hypothetical protein JCM6882_008017 [Rhodosporidiobolus microsporus]